MKSTRSLILAGCFLPLVALVSGCGYNTVGDDPKSGSNYQWRSLYREDVRTVAVPIFKNKDFHRGVEFALSKAVVSQIEKRSPYKVVGKDKADTILEGEITAIRLHNVSNDTHAAIPQEQIYEIKVNFTWKDLRSGRVLCQRENFEQTTSFYPTVGEDQFVGSQQGVERLALGIVQEMEADW